MSATLELLRAAQEGDRDACEQAVIENNGLIWSVVRRYYGRGVDPEDALHRACDKFDRRFRAVEEAADKPLPECGEAELLALWNDAKSHDPS